MIRALLFDKDGTLFDFRKSWEDAFLKTVKGIAAGDEALFEALCAHLLIDPDGYIHPRSPLVHAAGPQLEAMICARFPQLTGGHIQSAALDGFAGAEPVPVRGLAPLLARLSAEGFEMAVVTNDSESAARADLERFNIARYFGAVIGFDSGHGMKPEPGMCLAALEALGEQPEHAVMIGDTVADISAGRAAGCHCVAVLTGTSERADLAPLADAVLEDISHLPGWLAQVQ